MNPRSSEDEITWACLCLLLAGMFIASGVWAWWSSEFFWGYFFVVLGVFGLLRGAKHLQTAWELETADREHRERQFRRWAENIQAELDRRDA